MMFYYENFEVNFDIVNGKKIFVVHIFNKSLHFLYVCSFTLISL